MTTQQDQPRGPGEHAKAPWRLGCFSEYGRLRAVVVGSLEDLATMELWPDGSLIEIEDLDIHISVDGMSKAALPVLVPRRIVAGIFAASGGAVKSKAKAESSKQNGRKGGTQKEGCRRMTNSAPRGRRRAGRVIVDAVCRNPTQSESTVWP